MRSALVSAAILLSLSWAVVYAGILAGRASGATGQGYPRADQVNHDLFRFDSYYYLDIAEHGYSYNGDPGSSPNIVFAPMFPLLVAAVGVLPGLDLVTAGFVVNKILLFGALVFLWLVLRAEFSSRKTFLVLLSMVTSAGAYSLHAYYSESTMLFFLAFGLYAYHRRWDWPLALSACALGVSRWSGAAMAGVWAVVFLRRAIQRRSWQAALGAGVCLAGVTAQIVFIAVAFGNPFVLLPEVQSVSWGLFHQSESLADKLIALGFWRDWALVFGRGWTNFADIKTLNLIWFTLMGASVVYLAIARRRSIWLPLFGVYFLLIYDTSIGSDFLISAHRFSVLMLPIFVMAAAGHSRLARATHPALAWTMSGLLLLVNVLYGILHTALFNQGTWYYF